MTHAFYVYSAWGVSVVVIVVMIAVIMLDGRRQQNELKRLDKAGIRRRSADAPAQQPGLEEGGKS